MSLNSWISGLAVAGKPDELEVKQLLREIGIKTPKGVRLLPEDPVTVDGLSPPFAVKICSGEILHKTDQGGVELHVKSEALLPTITAMRQRFDKAALLVEEQLQVKGPECIVGALVDPEFGPAVMVGAGGIMTEIYQDVAFRLAPCSTKDAGHMLDELRIAPIFHGFRGLDLNPHDLAETISLVSKLAVDLGKSFSQLDINPIAFCENEWYALDAKLVLAQEELK